MVGRLSETLSVWFAFEFGHAALRVDHPRVALIYVGDEWL
jgi:hypothetical protein